MLMDMSFYILGVGILSFFYVCGTLVIPMPNTLSPALAHQLTQAGHLLVKNGIVVYSVNSFSHSYAGYYARRITTSSGPLRYSD